MMTRRWRGVTRDRSDKKAYISDLNSVWTQSDTYQPPFYTNRSLKSSDVKIVGAEI